ncbi:MAG TPA: hypothetical protein VH054_01950 [Polyangiaceae bacterium]|nr:hypothetical protein [Polyangiaceae bacterium]
MSSKNLLALLLLALCACHSSCAGDESQNQTVEAVEAGPVLGAPRPIPRMRPGQRSIGIIAPPNVTGSVIPPDKPSSTGP